jgi:plastocyanin
MRTVLVALLALAFAPSMVYAGGGSKQNGTIQVTNSASSRDPLFVSVDPNGNIQTALTTNNSVLFTQNGGQIVQPGATATFSNLQAGTHNVAAAYVNQGAITPAVPVGGVTSQNVTVNKGQTVHITVTEGTVTTGSTGGTATFSVQ